MKYETALKDRLDEIKEHFETDAWDLDRAFLLDSLITSLATATSTQEALIKLVERNCGCKLDGDKFVKNP